MKTLYVILISYLLVELTLAESKLSNIFFEKLNNSDDSMGVFLANTTNNTSDIGNNNLVSKDFHATSTTPKPKDSAWKWITAILVLIIVIPIILVCLVRKQKDRKLEFAFLSSEHSISPGTELRETCDPTLVVLTETIKLVPCLEGSDSFILEFGDSSALTKDLPKDTKDTSTENIKIYCLQPNKALRSLKTGMLYHFESGLVFVPFSGCYFDPKTNCLYNSLDDKWAPAVAHQVYDIKTMLVYERCLFMAYDMSEGVFFRPVTPSRAFIESCHGIELQPAIRWIKENEAPEDLRPIYKSLLKGEQDKRIQSSFQFFAQEKTEPCAELFNLQKFATKSLKTRPFTPDKRTLTLSPKQSPRVIDQIQSQIESPLSPKLVVVKSSLADDQTVFFSPPPPVKNVKEKLEEESVYFEIDYN